jgi:hypothetical protein
MKYCVRYFQDFRYFDIVDEVVLESQDSTHDSHLLQHIKDNYTTQRIIIDIRRREEEISEIIPILKQIKEEYPNFTVLISYSEDAVEQLKQAEIPFFFQEYCSTKEVLYAFIKIGVSDVYVVEDLAFSIKSISPYCKENNVKVRMFPNVAQCGKLTESVIPDIAKFFIRPEDVNEYEKYVDVLEFFGPPSRMSVLFEIYNSKRWLGDLNELIIGFEDSYSNPGISYFFGEVRTKCDHRCMIEDCDLCGDIGKLSNKIQEVGIEIIKKEDKDWRKKRNETKEPRVDEEREPDKELDKESETET